jgi:hypothetical protein
MIRAGVCLDCAVPVYEQIMQHRGAGEIPIQIQPCSGSCYEAIEHYLADPMVWRLKPDPRGGKARQAKLQNCLRGDASKKRFRN